MRPFPTFTADEAPGQPVLEAAPARRGVRFVALGVFAVLLLLAGRAVQLAFAGDPLADRRAVVADSTARADIVDRNGVLLATTVRAYALTAAPARVWNPRETATALIGLFPDLDRAVLERRLADTSRQAIYLRRGLTPAQRDAAHGLGLAGIAFETEDRRAYPNGAMAAHALGFTDRDLNPLAGVERGLDDAIRIAGAEGRPLTLSLDIRLQYVLEGELDVAARAAQASGGAAILLDGRTGETLAMASWPAFDPNDAGAALDNARRDRVAGDVHELGSTIKPFTLAMALDEQLTTPTERFDLMQPLIVDGAPIHDHEPVRGMSTIREMLAQSSNIGVSRLALRIGGETQRSYLDRLGLLAPSALQSGRRQAPIAPAARSRRDVAGLGFGYGLAATPAALAGAYTVFANDGARVAPTLLARAEGETIERTPVFTPATTRLLRSYLRSVVANGTGRAAEAPVGVIGKTGTAEQLGVAGYDEDRNFSSFAGLFPAADPRYVIVVALDEPRAAQAGGLTTGGAVAAPAVSRMVTRAAPLLGLRAE